MTEQNDIVKPGSNPLAAADFGDFAGMGFENQTNQDIAIPFMGVLQAMSPQVNESEPSYISGAKAGDLFNTVTGELIPRPATFVPCYTEHVYVEWVPRDAGGGFVAVHGYNSEVVVKAKAGAEKFNDLKTPEGNQLVETFYVYGLLLDAPDAQSSSTPIVIAFTSTKIKVYKALMTKLRTIKGNPPLFAFRLAVATCDAKNKKNQPYKNFKITPVGATLFDSANLPGTPFAGLLEEGKALVEAIKGGLARAAVESQAPSREPGEDGEGETEPF